MPIANSNVIFLNNVDGIAVVVNDVNVVITVADIDIVIVETIVSVYQSSNQVWLPYR